MVEILKVIFWLIMIGVSSSLLALIHKDIQRDREFVEYLEKIQKKRNK